MYDTAQVSEVQLFAFWHHIRDRALAFVSTSSAAFTDKLMNLILKTVAEGSQTSASGWRKQPGAASSSRFEHPSGGIAIDLQTGEVFFKAGAGMKMPAEIAQSAGKPNTTACFHFCSIDTNKDAFTSSCAWYQISNLSSEISSPTARLSSTTRQ